MTMTKDLPMVPADADLTERLNCTSLTFSGVTLHDEQRPFIRLRVTLLNGWVVWTDVDFDSVEAAFDMHKSLLYLKMHADATTPLNKLVDKTLSAQVR